MITTSSTVCATSERTWLDDENGPALLGERAQEVTKPADPLRVEAVRRLVQNEHLRVAEKSCRETESLAHAEGVALHAPAGRRAHVHQSEDLVDARPRDAPAHREHPQVVPTRASRMRIERLQQHADSPDGVVELGIWPAEYGGPPRRRTDEAEDRAHRGRLACAVRSEESRDPSRLDREGQVVDGQGRAEPLREAFDLDHASIAAGWPETGRDEIRASMATPGAVYPRLEPGREITAQGAGALHPPARCATGLRQRQPAGHRRRHVVAGAPVGSGRLSLGRIAPKVRTAARAKKRRSAR